MTKRLSEIGTFLSKYFGITKIFVVVFLFIMLFIDENSILQSFRYSKKIKELNKEIELYQGIVKESQTRLHELQSNDENLEKFAREQYFMKKEEEDIYIIETDTTQNNEQ